MNYRHQRPDGRSISLPPGKIVCVGRNYADHARELGNAVPAEPLLFIKPGTALADLLSPLQLPRGRGSCHHEAELAVLIGAPLTASDARAARAAVAGWGLGLDL